MRKLLIAMLLVCLPAGVAQATVDSEVSRNEYTGNGVVATYPYTFRILNQTEILVFVNNVRKTLLVDYTVSGANGPAGGSVIFITAPPSGNSIVFTRNVPFTQTTDYIPNQAINTNTLETNFDKLTMITQQLGEQINRAILLPPASTASGVFPPPGAGLCIKWNTSGSALEASSCGTGGGGGGGISNLNGLSAGSQSFQNDSNVTISSSGATHSLGWSGVLPIDRGGTGANTAAGARAALGIGGASALDVVDVPHGGTGNVSITANAIMVGVGAAPTAVVGPGAANSVLTGTGGFPAFSTQPSLVSLTTSGPINAGGGFVSTNQAAVTLNPFSGLAGSTSELRFAELAINGTNYVGIKAPDNITANKVWTWPALDGSAGHVLTTNGAGVLSFAPAGGGGTGITSLEGQTGASQTFTDDANVAIISAADVHVITWLGQLAVARGGTGASAFNVNGVLYGNGTSAVQSTAVGPTNSVLTASGAAPSFSATPTVTALTATGNLQGATLVARTTSGVSRLQFFEDPANGTDILTINGPTNMAAPVTWTLPAAQGGVNQVLTNNGSGLLSWSDKTTGAVNGTALAGQAAFWSGTSTIAGDALFQWDSTAKFIRLGTTPATLGYPAGNAQARLVVFGAPSALTPGFQGIVSQIDPLGLELNFSVDRIAVAGYTWSRASEPDEGHIGGDFGLLVGALPTSGASQNNYALGVNVFNAGGPAGGAPPTNYKGGIGIQMQLSADINNAHGSAGISFPLGRCILRSPPAAANTPCPGGTAKWATGLLFQPNSILPVAAGGLAAIAMIQPSPSNFIYIVPSDNVDDVAITVTENTGTSERATIMKRGSFLGRGSTTSAAIPTFSFTDENTMGMYRHGTGVIGWSTGGAVRMTLEATGLTVNGALRPSDGTVGAPAFAFSTDTNTGIYRSANDQMTLVTGGVNRLTVANTTTTVHGQLSVADTLAIQSNTLVVVSQGGAGNAYACLSATGVLFRGGPTCPP